jgi:Xaa-Pro dipeptidase
VHTDGIFYEADFPRAEYEARYARARRVMEELGIDALLLSLGIHIRYLAGYRTPFWGDAPGIPLALIPRDPAVAPALILSRHMEFTAGTSWIEDVRYVSPERPAPFNDQCDLAADLVKSKGLARGAIAMDVGDAVRDNMPTIAFDRIRAALPDARVVDAATVMSPLRQVKSAAEIEVLRRACHTTCAAWQAGLEALREGMSEKELAAVVCSAILSCGEEAGLIRPWALYMASGRDMAVWCNVLPSPYRLQQGDLVLIDGGATCKGYHADIIRWGAIGPLSDEDRYLADVATEANAACRSAIKAGVSCAEIHRVGAEVYRRSQIDHDDWKVWGPAGHGVGLEVHEAPFLTPANPLATAGDYREALLQAGMVITVEPLIVKTRSGRFAADPAQCYQGRAPDMCAVEDNVVVTDGGCELLTPLQPYVWRSL